MGLFSKKDEIKRIAVNVSYKKDLKKLQRYLDDGWEILSEHRRSALSWKPGWIDYVLVRKRK